MSEQQTTDGTDEKNTLTLYLTEYDDGKDEEPTQRPGVTWWTLGYCISLRCDSDENARKLFEGLQHVTEIDAD